MTRYQFLEKYVNNLHEKLISLALEQANSKDFSNTDKITTLHKLINKIGDALDRQGYMLIWAGELRIVAK